MKSEAGPKGLVVRSVTASQAGELAGWPGLEGATVAGSAGWWVSLLGEWRDIGENMKRNLYFVPGAQTLTSLLIGHDHILGGGGRKKRSGSGSI